MKKILSLLILIALPFILLFVILLVIIPKFSPHSSKLAVTSIVQTPEALIGTQLLTSEFPVSESLTLKEMPSFVDIRGVYSYGDNLIITGFDRIIEYNPKTNEFVRINRSDVLPPILSSALVGDSLYVSAVLPPQKPEIIGKKTVVYQIDVKTGSISNVLFSQDENDYTNLRLASFGDTLWGSSWNGVFKVDTISNQIFDSYDHAALGIAQDCQDIIVYANSSDVWVMSAPSDSCEGSISIYQPESNTWKSFSKKDFPFEATSSGRFALYGYLDSPRSIYTTYEIGFQRDAASPKRIVLFDSKADSWKKVLDYTGWDKELLPYKTRYFNDIKAVRTTDSTTLRYYYPTKNAKPQDTEKFFPKFFTLSNKVGDITYALTSTGLYSIVGNTLPKKLVNANIPSQFAEHSKFLITQNSLYGVVLSVRTDPYVDTWLTSEVVRAYVISLKDGNTQEVFGSVSKFQNPISGTQTTLLKDLSHAQLIEENGVVTIINEKSKKPIVAIDVDTKKVSFPSQEDTDTF